MADVYYTNFAEIRASFFDVTLTFSRVSEVTEKTPGELIPTVEQLARVQMSPQHARAFLEALQTTVKGYEEKFGPISIPSLDAAGKTSAK